MATAAEWGKAEWERAQQRRAGGYAIARIRHEAWSRFSSRRFPTTHDEEWRFTSVAPIAERTFALARPEPLADVDAYRLTDTSSTELVFVNGHYVPGLSR